MAVDFNKLNKAKKELEDKSSGSIIYASKIKSPEFEFRLLPPHPDMDGLPYFERICWSIGDKILTSRETFGEPCVMEDEVETAKALVDKYKSSRNPEQKQVAQELAQLLNDWKKCKKRSEYLLPILPIGEDDKVGEPKFLSCGLTVVKEIVNIMSNRKYQNGTPDGVADRVQGRNFTLTKTGEGKNTEYGIQPWPNSMEMPEVYYHPDKLINPVAFVKKTLKSEEHLVSVVRNYLYGDAIIEDTGAEGDAEPEAQQPKSSRETQHGTPVPTSRAAKQEPTPITSRGSRLPAGDAPAGTRRRNIMDDLENDEQ